MKSIRIGIFVTLLILAACKPADPVPSLLTLEAEITVSPRVTIAPPQLTPILLPGPYDTPTHTGDMDGEAEIVPTEVILAATPTLTPDVSVTPTVTITGTVGISETITTSATSILTDTLFTDTRVTRSGTIHQVAWDRDGARFGVATSVGLFLYRADTLDVERSFSVGEPVNRIDLSPASSLLVSGGINGDIQWWNPDTGKYLATFKGHAFGITSLVFAAGDQYLVSGSDDGTVRLWLPSQVLTPDITEYQPINILRATDRITSVDISQNAQIIAAGSFQTVSIWASGTGEAIQTLDMLTGWVRELSLSPDGKYLAAADSGNHLRVWRTENWILSHDIPVEQIDQISAMIYSSDGTLLALGGKNGAVVVWDMGANTIYDLAAGYTHAVTDLAFHPFEKILVSSYQDGLLRVWTLPP